MSPSVSKRSADHLERVDTSPSSRVMPTPCSPCARMGRVCRIELSSGRCTECIRLHRSSGKEGCDLLVTDDDWNKLLRLRQKVREELEKVADEDDQDQEALAAILQRQAERRRKRRKLESRYLKLHAEQGELVEREFDSIREIEALEAAERAKVLDAAKAEALPEGVVPSSGPEAPESEDPLAFLDFPASYMDGGNFALGDLPDGTVGFVSSPS